jgi:hypothetical protein
MYVQYVLVIYINYTYVAHVFAKLLLGLLPYLQALQRLFVTDLSLPVLIKLLL